MYQGRLDMDYVWFSDKTIGQAHEQDYRYERVFRKYLYCFSTKPYVMGTQKNRLNETVLLSTQNNAREPLYSNCSHRGFVAVDEGTKYILQNILFLHVFVFFIS